MPTGRSVCNRSAYEIADVIEIWNRSTFKTHQTLGWTRMISIV